MTCRLWNITARPHLHYSLTMYLDPHEGYDEKYCWPEPLKKLYELELLPFIKRLRIRTFNSEVTPKIFDSDSTLHCFSALTNIQELQIDNLRIPSFMPKFQEYFGHFTSTVQRLDLYLPEGSCRQIIYFIGLFPNLQDLTINSPVYPEEEVDSTLIPHSKPPLHGSFTLVSNEGETLVREMIKLFNGLRFRRMHLNQVECTRLLLKECAETLETLQLHSTDPGENFY